MKIKEKPSETATLPNPDSVGIYTLGESDLTSLTESQLFEMRSLYVSPFPEPSSSSSYHFDSIDCPKSTSLDNTLIPFLYVKRIVISFTDKIIDDICIKINNVRFPDGSIHNLQRKFDSYVPNDPHPTHIIETLPDGSSKIPYGSIVDIEAFNGWAGQFSLSCWNAYVYFNNDMVQRFYGGNTFIGNTSETQITDPNIPNYYDYRTLGSFSSVYVNHFNDKIDCRNCDPI